MSGRDGRRAQSAGLGVEGHRLGAGCPLRLAWHSILALVARSSVAQVARATMPALRALASLPVKQTRGATRGVPQGRPGRESAEPQPPTRSKAAAFLGHGSWSHGRGPVPNGAAPTWLGQNNSPASVTPHSPGDPRAERG